MFKKKEQVPGRHKPHLIIHRTHRPNYRTHRFFFLERLHLADHKAVVEPQLIAIDGVFPDEGVRYHPHYIAVQWTDQLAFDTPHHEVERIPQLIESKAVEALSRVFGWKQPNLEHIDSHAEILAKGRRYGVDWDLGSY